MTVEIRARGTEKNLSPIRYLIFIDNEEVACFRGLNIRGRIAVRHVTLYSNVMSGETTGIIRSDEEVERRTQQTREAIRKFIDEEGKFVFFSEEARNRFFATKKTWTQRIPHVPQPKVE